MPIISIDLNHVDDTQKKRLIEDLTAAAAEITKMPAQSFTVLIRELEDRNIGVAGVPLDEIKRKRAQG